MESDRRILESGIFESSKLVHDWLSNASEVATFLGLVDSTIFTLKNSAKIIFFGNGGSAAESSHLAGEFVGKCERDVGALPAISLTDSSAMITAISNDWSFDEVFSRQICALGNKGDLLIGLSTSGSSLNVHRGLIEGKNKGLRTSLWTSRRYKGKTDYIDHLLVVPTDRTPRAQELHLILGHILCEYVESALKTN